MNSQLPLTAPFLASPGEPSIPWKEWKRSFQNYLVAQGATATTFPEERRVALLILALGTEGERIFHSIRPEPDPNAPDTLDSIFMLLDGHFGIRENVVAARVRYRERVQLPGERVDTWFADLRRLVVHCNYRSLEEELLRDQIVEKTNNPRVRERLLMEPDLKLQKALSLARQIEQAVTDARSISKSSSTSAPTGASVNRVHQRGKGDQGHQTRGSSKRSYTNAQPSGTSQGNKAKGSSKCSNGGLEGHKRRDPGCPALNASCSACGKKGHYARVCRSSGKGTNNVRNVDSEEQVQLVQILHITANSTTHSHPNPNPVWIEAQVSSQNHTSPMRLLVDTGCSTSVMPYCQYIQHFPARNLTPTVKTASAYGNSALHVYATLPTEVTYRGRTVTSDFLVVDAKGDTKTLLGLDLFYALGMCIQTGDQEHIQAMTLHTIQSEYPALFSSQIRTLKEFQHRILLKEGTKPVAHKLRRLPVALKDRAIQELRNMEKDGIIEQIEAADWVSPMVAVPKSNQEVRVCADLKDLSKNVVPDRFPLPTTDEILAEIENSQVFSKIDLRKAYFQVALTMESRALTAFLTPIGLFQYTRLPMGYVSSGSVFQKAISIILAGIPGVIPLVDDILIHGATTEQHDHRLNMVLSRLNAAGATVEPRKMVIRQHQIEFNGHVLSADGVLPLHDNVEAIRNMPKPGNSKEMPTFLGTCTYYIRFLPNFSTLCQPLREATKDICGKEPIQWNEDTNRAYQAIKAHLSSSPILGYYRHGCQTIVTTDASKVGIGAALSQIQNGQEVTLAYASRTLSPTESRYSTMEREALAVVWACERWKMFLWGFSFTVRTDQQAFVSLFNSSMGSKGQKPLRIARWYLRLSEFDYAVQHQPGKSNVVVDALSRLPIPTQAKDTLPESWSDNFVAFVTGTQAISADALVHETLRAPQLSKVCKVLKEGWPSQSQLDPDLRGYYPIRDQLPISDGIIIRGSYVCLVPKSLQNQAPSLAHEGHPGVVRSKQRIRAEYWWPGMIRDVELYVSNCGPCQAADKTTKQAPPLLEPIPLPKDPWSQLGLDIAGPYSTAPAQKRFLMVLQDYTSKWPEVASCGVVTSGAIIQFLETIFSRQGLPKSIVTDNGPQFISAEFQAFLLANNIAHHRTAVYHAQANGMVERFNRVLKEGMQIATLEGKTWDSGLRDILVGYRSTPHAATGLTPFEILHGGLRMRTKLTAPILPKNPAKPKWQDRVQKYQAAYKERSDAKATSEIPFRVGDWVRHLLPTVPKGKPSWSSPLQIVRQCGPGTFKLQNGKTWNCRKLRKARQPAVGEERESEPFYGPDSILSPQQMTAPLQQGQNQTVAPQVQPGQSAVPPAPISSSNSTAQQSKRLRYTTNPYQAGFG